MTRKSSLQRDLDRFFKTLQQSDFNIREVTKGALSKSRSNLNPEAFKRLNDVGVKTSYNEVDYDVWGVNAHRVLAIDGSRLMLSDHPTVKEEFGEHGFGPNGDSIRSLALCSLLYNVLNQVTFDGQIAPYSSSESDLLLNLDRARKGDF